MSRDKSTNTTEDISALDPIRRAAIYEKMVSHYEKQLDNATDDKSIDIAISKLQNLLINAPKIIGFQY